MVEIQSPNMVIVSVSSTATSFVSERRFDRGSTIAELMQKLELITGTLMQDMLIEVYKEDKFMFKLDNPDALLGSYHIDNGMRLHVVDKNPQGANIFNDLSKVEKYSMTDNAYEQRHGTVRSFLKQNKLGKFNPDEISANEHLEKEKKIEDEAALRRIKVGLRCQVSIPGQMVRRGEVKYIGYTDFQSNVWVGVQYDEPYGKHNGTVKGKSYFTCEQGYGSFVRPKHVECGEFPELDIEDDEM